MFALTKVGADAAKPDGRDFAERPVVFEEQRAWTGNSGRGGVTLSDLSRFGEPAATPAQAAVGSDQPKRLLFPVPAP